MIRWRRLIRISTAAAGAVLVVFLPTVLFGHAVVFPRLSTPGAYERYVLRVPNEKNVATTRVELRFPTGLRVISFAEVPGWRLETITDSSQAIVGAVWTGTLPPKRFVEFPFMAVNPKVATSIAWPAYQTYADGQRVEWTGARESSSPASVTDIAPAAMGPSENGRLVSWAALAIGIVALAVATLTPRPGKLSS
jgi:uncharacterized protein YcnI